MTKKMRRRAGLLTGMAIGAMAMYFFDPDRGRGRRTRARDKLAAKQRQMRRERERAVRYQEGVMQGLAHSRGPESPPADDHTLADRIKSELGPRLHSEHVSIDVADGVVELRGELENEAMIEDLVMSVAQVPYVNMVVSLLHLPGQPAPNKADAIDASRRAQSAATTQHVDTARYDTDNTETSPTETVWTP
jgi:osmotically-inducible protein OsmY